MADDEYLRVFFRKLARRDLLSNEERDALRAAAGAGLVYEAKSDLVTEGDRPVISILLLDGFASRYRLLEDGSRQITAIHVPGDFVDLHGFVLKEMDHSVGALSHCQAVAFAHTDLQLITETFPHLTRLLWLMTMIDAGIQREWMVAMGRRSAAEQMARLVCELYVRLDVAGLIQANAFDLPLTQVELADALGISAVHVNRVMQELRAEGLFTWEGSRVTILHWDRLAQRAGFDDAYLHLEREPR